MSTVPQHCIDCRFYNDVGLYPRGECRRNAPRLKRSSDSPYAAPDWPIVRVVDWCGEFKRKLSA